MRLVLDEDLSRLLVAHFATDGHEVVHVEELGWKGIRNSELLRRISGDYDLLITGDTNMRHQQQLARFDVAVIVLHPRLKVDRSARAIGARGALSDPHRSTRAGNDDPIRLRSIGRPTRARVVRSMEDGCQRGRNPGTPHQTTLHRDAQLVAVMHAIRAAIAASKRNEQ